MQALVLPLNLFPGWLGSLAGALPRSAMVIGSFAVNALDVLAIWVIFEHTGSLAGFGLAEVMFLYGSAGLSFAAPASSSPRRWSARSRRRPRGPGRTSGRA